MAASAAGKANREGGLLFEHVEDFIQLLRCAEDTSVCAVGGPYLAYHCQSRLALDEFRGAVSEQHGVTAVFQMGGELGLDVRDDIATEQLVAFEAAGFFVASPVISANRVRAARVVKITGAHHALDIFGGQQRFVKLRRIFTGRKQRAKINFAVADVFGRIKKAGIFKMAAIGLVQAALNFPFGVRVIFVQPDLTAEV